MKKTITVLLITLLVIMVSGATSAFAEGAKESGSSDNYVIKMATPSNPEDSCVKAFFHFKELVEKNSDGRIEVQVLHSGQLGGHRDYIEGLQMGSLQMAEINTSVLSAIDDQFMIFSLPYIAKSVDHAVRVIEDGVGERLSKTLEDKTGIKIIGWMVRTPRSVYNSRRPIKTANDFSGLKIRVMESPVMMKTMELLGAKPVPLSANERYMALQTKVVDAAENSPPLIITEKEYEVTNYLSLTEHFVTPNIIAIDSKFLEKMPEDLQKIILDAGEEAGDYAIKQDKEQLAGAIDKLEELGMEVNQIPDKSSFINKVKPLYAEYQDRIGKDLIDAFVNSN